LSQGMALEETELGNGIITTEEGTLKLNEIANGYELGGDGTGDGKCVVACIELSHQVPNVCVSFVSRQSTFLVRLGLYLGIFVSHSLVWGGSHAFLLPAIVCMDVGASLEPRSMAARLLQWLRLDRGTKAAR